MGFFAEETKKIKIDNVSIVIKKLSVGDQLEVGNIGEDKLATGAFEMVRRAIVSWDAKDKEGKELPVSPDNIKKMSLTSFRLLSDAVIELNGISEEQVKNLKGQSA